MTTIPKLSEKTFMAQVIALARLCGWRIYHTHDSRRSTAGFPDLILIRDGRLIAAELKVGKNKLTPDQAAWLRDFHHTGATAVEWRPDDWPEILKQLKR